MIEQPEKVKKVDYDNENGFVNDALRLLKAGRPCYAYKQEQANEICNKFKEKYKIDVNVEKVDFYFLLTVNKTVQKRMFF